VLLPDEIRFALTQRADRTPPYRTAKLEELDFYRNPSLRRAIHDREGGYCFYFLRRLNPNVQYLDHVVPQAEFGKNSYRNLVSCCIECNSRKGETPAATHFRWLYRQRRLTSPELAAGLRVLEALAAGKLRPTLGTPATPPVEAARLLSALGPGSRTELSPPGLMLPADSAHRHEL
jgi:5-methylcytosine-specific restriction endonuclease McrA